MTEDDGNGEGVSGKGAIGNPYVGDALCTARRATMDQKIISLRNQIIGAITLSTTILLLVSYLK